MEPSGDGHQRAGEEAVPPAGGEEGEAQEAPERIGSVIVGRRSERDDTGDPVRMEAGSDEAEQRPLAVPHPEHLRRAGGGANVVERSGDVLREIGVEGPAARRVLPRRPRGSVAAQVDGEAVEARLGKSARDGVTLDAEVQVAAIGGEAVTEEHGWKSRLPPRRFNR